MGRFATRRLLQFRLRTMFVVTALAAAALGWKMNFVQQRSAVMRSIEARGGRFDTRAANVSPQTRQAVINRLVDHMTSREHGTHGVCRSFEPTVSFELSWLRRFLGDKLYWDVVIYDRADLETVQRWFPEAAVLLVEAP
jgi:hypothetical protein